MREARPITTQNPSVGLYRFAAAFPGHREHVALQRQPFASAWPVAILHLEGPFQNVREARPITTQNPSVGLYRFATAFPGHREHVALQRQPFASAWPCRHTPFRGFQNVREARPITTQNPSVGLYRFATAFPSHREHVALQRQPFASAWPCRHTPFRGFQNVREARPITTQNPSVGLYRFATAFPGHREHVALQRQPFASAWPVAILHLEGFKTCAKHGEHEAQRALPSRHKTCAKPGHVGLYRFATAFPSHREHVALQRQPFASAWPVAILHLEGFKTCAKHGPSRHKTPLWAFTALPLPSQVTANTLPCSGSPLPAPGHVAILHLEGFKTCAKHGPSRHKTRLWAFTALPLPSQVTANTLPCSGSPLPAPGHVAILHLEGFKTCAKHGPSRHKTRLWAFTALRCCPSHRESVPLYRLRPALPWVMLRIYQPSAREQGDDTYRWLLW